MEGVDGGMGGEENLVESDGEPEQFIENVKLELIDENKNEKWHR